MRIKRLLVTCWCLVVVHAVSAAPDATTATGSRRRRQTNRSEYFVDIFVIVDYPIYTSWVSRSNPTGTQTGDQVAMQDIKRYFTLVIQEVSEQYSRLQTMISFRPVGFYIAKTQAESAIWTTGLGSPTATVNATKALENLITWLKNNSSRLPLYDHAMLFTGGDLGTDEKGHTKGKATVGTLCKQDRWQSVSVIEDHGGFESVQTAAHELGHSLSAKHDGLENTCTASDGYIMATGIYNGATSSGRNAWLFSNCTAREIQTYVTGGLSSSRSFAACLGNQLNQTEVPSVARVVPGQLYAPETICKHLHGDASYFCYDGNAQGVCTSLACQDPSVANVQCKVYLAPSGTSCGNKQWCQQGECVASTTAPSLPADCPLGDANLIRWNGLTCPEVSRQQPHLCYKTEVQQSCCHSCGLIRTSVPGCEYGDRTKGCTPYACSTDSSTCCRTCQSLQPACADQAVDGLPCAAAVSRDGVQQCYNATVASLCCQTCSQKLNRNVGDRPGCEYGDRRLQGCPVYRTAAGSSKTCDSQQCCQTCAGSVVCVVSFPLLLLAFTALTAFYWM